VDEVETMILPRKKRPDFFSMPSTKTGKLVLYGTILAIILSAGGIFMAWKTLVPPEITQLGKAESPIPEGLTPKETSQETVKKKPGKTVQPPAASKEITSEAPPAKPLAAPKMEKAQAPSVDKVKLTTATKDFGEPSPGLQAALHPKSNSVILSTIMPVSYNVNDIRVLSFRLVVELTDPESANTVREALPIFENITVNTVEQLLENKFYNDILYIKEKLQKDILKAFNNKISGGGRVKRVRFKDFIIQ
jgi:flagellar basal body-associated protein FliL